MKPRSGGSVYRPLYQDRAGNWVPCRVWMFRLKRGDQVWRETGFRTRADAEARLLEIVGEVERGGSPPNPGRTRYDELEAILITDYEVNRRRSRDRIRAAVAHLSEMFKGWLASAIPAAVGRYVASRQSEGAANATINRELAALKRMFRLGERVGKVSRVPHVPLLAEHNTRTGFF